MAANWLKVDGHRYINANRVIEVNYLVTKNKYELTYADKNVETVDTVEHATTFDITEEKEN